MYYLHKKTKTSNLPAFHWIFKSFEEFYDIARIIEVPLIGVYYIQIKSEEYQEIVRFIDIADTYNHLMIYIETSESLLEYVTLRKPNVSLLASLSNYEVFKSLVEKHGILFAEKCLDKVYFAIDHSYEEMDEALSLIKLTYPDKDIITEAEISQLFVIDYLTYPRSVAIAYLRMDRGRQSKLNRCITQFGNNLALYAMRKTVRKLLDEKIAYLKTGKASYLIKTIPIKNLTLMMRCLDYDRRGFMDIRTILNLYEKGETINDIVQKRTCTAPHEKYYDARHLR